MRRKGTWLLYPVLALLLAFCLAVPANADGPVPLPHNFYGSLTIDTEPAPAGTEVEARVEGVITTEVNPITTTEEGEYGGPGPLEPKLEVQGYIEEGAPIEFYVDEVRAQCREQGTETWQYTYPWHSGGRTELDLRVGEVPADTTAPTVTITALTPDPTNTNTPTFTGTATDTESNITSVQYRVDTGSWSWADASDGTFNSLSEGYTFTTSAFPDGAHTVYVRATDTAANTTAEVNYASDSYIVDTEAPTVVINSTASDPTNISPIPVTATFSEDVTGFVVGDIAVGNGSADNFVAVSGTVYTFDVTPDAEDEVTVDIAAGVAQDAATTPNEAATQFSITYTTAVLAVTIDAVTTPTNVATQTLTGTRSAGLTVVLTADTAATFGAVSYPTTTTWSAVVTLVEGSNGITATADTSTATATIVLDTIAPTVVSESPAAGATGVAIDIVVSAAFSEDVTAVDLSGITIAGATGVSATLVEATDTITIAHDDFALSTSYTVTIPAGAVQDTVGNPNAEYIWSFTTATASLADLIAGTASGGTLLLAAGTYTGCVTISQPITITGTVGTIISGCMHILPLTGSEVTIENLTITDYTDYGIWIEKVRDVDTFIIRNNTILGVEGSVVGIKVDEVVTGGSLIIRENAISGNEVGIKLLADVADGTIHFNDFTGNTIGLELVEGAIVSAPLNWWSDISGPEEENWNPGGIGNAVVGNIPFQDYQPWLTRQFQTVLDDNIAYYGIAMLGLDTGWNIISTPIALDPACDTWGEYVDLGDGLDVHATNPAYSFDGATQNWVQLTGSDPLVPCDAIYVRMASQDIAAILYSPDVSVPAKQLYAGWNLVSLAWLPTSMEDIIYGLPADEALVSVAEVTGGLTGYVLVVSPSVNPYEGSWIYTAGQSIGPWTDPEVLPPDGWMLISSGYWVFMLNDGTLAGFTFTPVSLN